MSSISLCVIARNEERHIARCLNSARPFVDQMVVVDTGSDDRTMEIARGLGAEVYRHEWRDDFSRARNQSLGYADREWILFLDCDEELDAQTASSLMRAVENPDYDGYWLKLINIFDNQSSTSLAAFRLFRNNPDYRFELSIHEQILPSILRHSKPERIGRLGVNIYHYGYEIGEGVLKSKIERNLRILKKLQSEQGDFGFVNFYLGVEYQRSGEYQRALDHYHTSILNSSMTESYASAMIRSMAFCLMNLNRHQEALELIEKYQPLYPEYTDLVCLRGLLHLEKGDAAMALEALNRAISMGPPPEHYFSLHGIAGDKTLTIIKAVTDRLIQNGAELIEQGHVSTGFSVLESVFSQLRKTPDEDSYLRLIETMLSLHRSIALEHR